MKRAQHNSQQKAAEQIMLQALADCAKQIDFTKVDTDYCRIHGHLYLSYRKIILTINLSEIDILTSDHDVISFQVNIRADSKNRNYKDIPHTSYIMLKTIKYRFFLHGHSTGNILIDDFKKTYVIPYLLSIHSIVKGFSIMHLQKYHKEDLDCAIEGLKDCAIKLGFEPTISKSIEGVSRSINILIGTIVFTILPYVDKRKLVYSENTENVIVLAHNCYAHNQTINCIEFTYRYSLGDSEAILPEITEFYIKQYLCELYAWSVGMILSANLLSDIEDERL